MKYFLYPLILANCLLHFNNVIGFRVTFDNLTFIMNNIEPFQDTTVFNEDYPNSCYYSPTGQIWNVGEHWSPSGKCWIARCVKPGVATVYYCGVVSPADDGHTERFCRSVGMDLDQPFPRCCNRYLCKSLNSRPYIYNPVVPGGGKHNANFKFLSESRFKRPVYRIVLASNDTCRLNKSYM